MVGNIYILFDYKNKISRIGKSIKDNRSRQKGQIGYYPYQLIDFTFKVENYDEVETELHNEFKEININGDWYKCNPNIIYDFILENYDVLEYNLPTSKQVVEVMFNLK